MVVSDYLQLTATAADRASHEVEKKVEVQSKQVEVQSKQVEVEVVELKRIQISGHKKK